MHEYAREAVWYSAARKPDAADHLMQQCAYRQPVVLAITLVIYLLNSTVD